MKLIREEIEDVEFLVEERNGKKSFWITGPFLAADVKNRNGRVYESRILDPVVKTYVRDLVDKGRALGELSHPDSPSIQLERVSHKITELHKEGHHWIGKAKLLETPLGRVASALLNDGVSLGVSSRGMGSLVERDGAKFVGEDFMLATAADIVADPSGPECFVNGIYEQKEWVWNNGLLTEVQISNAKRRLDNCSRSELESVMLEEFERLLFS